MHTTADSHDVVLQAVAGSRLYGLATPTSDHDEMGVFVERPEQVMGLTPTKESVQLRTKPHGVRSDADSTDVSLYSLRKFAALAAQGNPTVLMLLFTRGEDVLHSTPAGEQLQALAPSLVSAQAGRRFLGYLDSQMSRFDGEGHVARMPKRPELVEAHGYDCYSDDTEFLTLSGWKTYDQIPDGEYLATLNQSTHEIEFQRPVDRVSKNYSGVMYCCETTATSWCVTENHRMFVSKVNRGPSGALGSAYRASDARWHFREMSEIAKGRTWHIRVSAGKGESKQFPIADDYLSLMGAYISEGCVGKRLNDGSASVIRIEQKDGGRLHAIMNLVARSYPLRSYRYAEKRLVTTWTLADREVAKRLEAECGKGSWHKKLPHWVHLLSARQVDVLLDAMLAGDGTPHRSGGWVYYSVSKELVDGLQAMLACSGRRSTVWGPYPQREESEIYQVRIHDRDTPSVASFNRSKVNIQKVDASNARVVCFTVPNETLVTRRNGKIAMQGNSKYVSHALRLAAQGVELLETGQLVLPMPDESRQRVYAVKTGQVSKDDAVRWVAEERAKLVKLLDDPHAPRAVPEHPNMDAVNAFLVDTHRTHWATAQ